jgi:viroplasmin and RNaseH domain-containing protein
MAWYVVHVGRKTGVFSTWDACHDQVIGFKGACYKKYKTREEAVAAFHGPQVEAKINPEEQGMILAQPAVAKKGGHKWKEFAIIVEGVIILVQALVILILLSKMM